MLSDSDLNLAITTYEKLISNHERVRQSILERRRSATDAAVMVELDGRLEANQQTIDALLRAVDGVGSAVPGWIGLIDRW